MHIIFSVFKNLISVYQFFFVPVFLAGIEPIKKGASDFQVQTKKPGAVNAAYIVCMVPNIVLYL